MQLTTSIIELAHLTYIATCAMMRSFKTDAHHDKEMLIMLREVATIAEAFKIITGEANAEARHLVVPMYMPLGEPVTPVQALRCLSPELREYVRKGDAELIAVAKGTMMGDQKPLLLVLFRIENIYHTYETYGGDCETALLSDGDGRTYTKSAALTREEALKQWMAGFLNWNCEVPGLYRLRFAMIEGEGPVESTCPKGHEQTPASSGKPGKNVTFTLYQPGHHDPARKPL